MQPPAVFTRFLFLCTAVTMLVLLVASAVRAVGVTENANAHDDTRILAQAMETRCEKGCTREYMPVCGSDGVTYANRCLFRNAKRCRYHGQLYIVKNEAC